MSIQRGLAYLGVGTVAGIGGLYGVDKAVDHRIAATVAENSEVKDAHSDILPLYVVLGLTALLGAAGATIYAFYEIAHEPQAPEEPEEQATN